VTHATASPSYSVRPFVGNIGDRVRVRGIGEGILRFHGWLHELEPLQHTPTPKTKKEPAGRREWFGVAMDEAVGHSDGSLKHGKYFDCQEGHGLFIDAKSDDIELVNGRFSNPDACYSPSCRQRRKSRDGALVAGCRCFTPICLSDLGGSARLAARPDDDTMVRDEASKSASWGLGRMLRAQRDEADLVASGGDADRVLVTAQTLGKARVRFTKCESPLVDAAVYTITISSAATESCMDSSADWIVERTFARLQAIHSLLKVELGEIYSKEPFPDALFSTAAGRMPKLQAWLQDAVALVPFCRPKAQGEIISLLGARLAAAATSEAPVAAAGPAALGPLDAPQGERLRIPVGASPTNSKRVRLPLPDLIVSPNPVNEQDPRWQDSFSVEVDGTLLTVRRVDADGGWSQDLELMALSPTPIIVRNSSGESSGSFTMQVIDPPPF